MSTTTLDSGDAAELAQMLQFLADRLTADPDLDTSLTRYVGVPAYGATQLRADLHRFVFLLGGDGGDDDGEQLFGQHTIP